MFCLWKSCVLTYASVECEHNKDEEHVLTGTWLLDEVRLDVEKCYKLCEIYELYEYQVPQFNPDTG